MVLTAVSLGILAAIVASNFIRARAQGPRVSLLGVLSCIVAVVACFFASAAVFHGIGPFARLLLRAGASSLSLIALAADENVCCELVFVAANYLGHRRQLPVRLDACPASKERFILWLCRAGLLGLATVFGIGAVVIFKVWMLGTP